MPETGVLLKDYVLPIITIFQLVCLVLAPFFILADLFAAMKISGPDMSRVDILNRGIKRLRHMKTWTLLLTVAYAFGMVGAVIVGSQFSFFINLLAGFIFYLCFRTAKRVQKQAQKELESANAVLFGKSDCL